MSNQSTNSDLASRIEALNQRNREVSIPRGSFSAKSVSYRGHAYNIEMTSVNKGRNLSLELNLEALLQHGGISEKDIIREEEITNAYSEAGAIWNFPFFDGERQEVGKGWLKMNEPDSKGNKPMFVAEGFINIGRLWRVNVWADSLQFMFESEDAAWRRTIKSMNRWQGSPTQLELVESLFDVDVEHLKQLKKSA